VIVSWIVFSINWAFLSVQHGFNRFGHLPCKQLGSLRREVYVPRDLHPVRHAIEERLEIGDIRFPERLVRFRAARCACGKVAKGSPTGFVSLPPGATQQLTARAEEPHASAASEASETRVLMDRIVVLL
jgi:hypothetical protein